MDNQNKIYRKTYIKVGVLITPNEQVQNTIPLNLTILK